MPHRAVAIANAFLRLPSAAETITQMQLQKLVYIAHGWNLAINDDSLVAEQPEAWTYGPVYRDLYDHTKFFGKSPIGREIRPADRDMAKFFLGDDDNSDQPYRAPLSDRERAVIENVWKRYGALSAIRLSELTHQRGTPWFQTFTTRGRNTAIENELIKPHYDALAARAA